jgi:hypothetical protein
MAWGELGSKVTIFQGFRWRMHPPPISPTLYAGFYRFSQKITSRNSNPLNFPWS